MELLFREKLFDMRFYILFVTFIVLSCKPTLVEQSTQENKSYAEYQLIKIDTIDEYYLLYFKDLTKISKVISKKNNDVKFRKKNKLKLGDIYNLKLIEMYENYDTSGLNIANYMSLKRCVKLHPSVKICNEPGIELYVTDNIIGDFYINENCKLNIIPSFEVKRNIIFE